MRNVPVGATGKCERLIGIQDLASTIEPSLAAVMSTPTMIALMEMAAMNAIAPYLDSGESSAGVAIEVRHLAATPPGHRVRAFAEVTKAEGKRLEFKVYAEDETEQVGTGVHRRAVVDSAKFAERLRAKVK